jgi:hypothetical protein
MTRAAPWLLAVLALVARPAFADPPKLVYIDSLDALHAAQKRGLKRSMIMSDAIVCPTIAKPANDPKPLAARGELARTVVDLDGFMRADIGVEEAVALLGPPVLCRASVVGTDVFIDMQLPTRGDVDVMLETENGGLIGIHVELAKPAIVDMAKLEKQRGPSRIFEGPMDAFEAGGNQFALRSDRFKGVAMFAHRSFSDLDTAWKVHDLIVRRWVKTP